MTQQWNVRLGTLLEVIESEVTCARNLLLDYESRVGLSESLNDTQRASAQGLDLAIQLLDDVAQLAGTVEQQIPGDSVQEYILPHSSIRLERVRAKLDRKSVV